MMIGAMMAAWSSGSKPSESWPGLQIIAVDPLTVSMQPYFGANIASMSANWLSALPAVEL